MSQVQSWQIQCRRCGWANSGAELRCMKCGFKLPPRPGMLVAGESAGAKAREVAPTKVAQPGGFFPRFIAFLIDWSILGAVGLVLFFVWQAALTPLSIDTHSGIQQALEDQARQKWYLLIGLALIRRLYFQGSWTILGASPGMRVFNLHIIQKDGEPVGFRRAYLRYMFLYGLFSIFSYLLSPFMVALSKKKQGLHDLVAGTYVIQYLDPEKVLEQHDKSLATPVPPPAPTPEAPFPVGAAVMTAAAVPAALSLPEPAATPPAVAQAPAAPSPNPTPDPPPAIASDTPAPAPAPTPPVAPAAPAPDFAQSETAPAPAPAAMPAPLAAPSPAPVVSPPPAAVPPPIVAPAQMLPIDPVPSEAPPAPQAAPPAPAPPPIGLPAQAPPGVVSPPPAAEGAERYSPPADAPIPPRPASIDPYPLPFTPAPPDIPPPAPPPRPHEPQSQG